MKTLRHLTNTKQQPRTAVKQTLKWLFWGLIVYLPLHVFISQSVSLLTGGLDIWKVAKDAVIIIGAALSFYLILPYLRNNSDLKRITIVGALYGLFHLIFVLFADLDLSSALLGSVYNLRPLMLASIGLAVGVTYRDTIKTATQKIILGISGFVASLGIIQYFLPNDFLLKLGYSFERGAREAFLIDDKIGLTRVMSTIRDPNSLGAFLIVTSSLTLALGLIAKPKVARKISYLLAIQLGALMLTFSRSAWLGLAVTFVIVIASSERFRRYFSLRNIVIGLTVIGVLFIVSLPLIRNSHIAENLIFHSDETTTEIDSNQKHINYLTDGASKIIRHPIGHGPGTAGIVSIRNARGTVLTENYYLQIGYEIGALGLVLFVYLNYLVYRLLQKSPKKPLKIALLASFWGLVVTNMLLHTWSNEAVAMIWWMIAGYQIGISDKLSSKQDLN